MRPTGDRRSVALAHVGKGKQLVGDLGKQEIDPSHQTFEFVSLSPADMSVKLRRGKGVRDVGYHRVQGNLLGLFLGYK